MKIINIGAWVLEILKDGNSILWILQEILIIIFFLKLIIEPVYIMQTGNISISFFYHLKFTPRNYNILL